MNVITVAELDLWQCCGQTLADLAPMGAALRAMGVDARHLDGGIAAWREGGHAVQALAGGAS